MAAKLTPVVLGIDLGTTEAKAALVGLDGRLIGLGRASYALDAGAGGRAEQDPRDWWRGVAEAVRRIEGIGDPALDVIAMCGVGQGPTLAAVDAAGEPIRPAITWQDRRPGGSGFGLLSRLAWLAREEPRSVADATWLLSAWDALGLWLSGEAATSLQGHEAALAPGDLRDAAIPGAKVPRNVPFGSRLGHLRPGAAEALGLRVGIPIVAGVNDGTASMLGAGLLEPGDAVDTGGASGGIGIYVDRLLELPGVFCAPAPIPGRWVAGGAMAAHGASLDWLRSSVLDDRWTTDELFADAAGTPPGADGLIFLPYLAGERAPIFDEAARGAFVGLALGHGRGHLVRAVLEGAAFSLRHVAEPITSASGSIRELRLAGRPTNGDVWARIKADVLGVRVAIPAIGETAVLGAAILAATGVGAVDDLATAVRSMTSVARRVEPDPATREAYDRGFALYRALYPALASVSRRP